MTDTDPSAALDKIRKSHRQHVSENFPAPGICVSRCAERYPCSSARLLAAVDAVLTLADAIAVPHAPARNSYEGGYVDAERQLGKVFREEVARALTGEEAAP
jgi:hypothetical protein